MKPSIKRILFYIVFLVLVFAPAVVMFLEWQPRNILINISVLLGFVGLALAGTQLIQVSKLHFLADALDMDAVYRDHHMLSLVAIALVLVHPLILIVINMVNRPVWGWSVVAGWIGLAALLLIGLTSVARLKLKLSYTLWLALHDLFTAAIVVFGLIHAAPASFDAAGARLVGRILAGAGGSFMLEERLLARGGLWTGSPTPKSGSPCSR